MMLPGVQAHHALREAHDRAHDVLDHDDGDALLRSREQDVRAPRPPRADDSPAITSSRISRRGRDAIARASSSLRRSTCVKRAGQRSRPCRPAPSSARSASASPRTSAACSDRRCATYSSGIATFSASVMLRTDAGSESCAPCPSRVRRCVGSRVTSAPSNPIEPRVAAQRAADAVDQRGLARAVGPDDAEPLAAPHAQAHVRERGEAAEALGHRADLEQRRHVRSEVACEATLPRGRERSPPSPRPLPQGRGGSGAQCGSSPRIPRGAATTNMTSNAPAPAR